MNDRNTRIQHTAKDEFYQRQQKIRIGIRCVPYLLVVVFSVNAGVQLFII